jgi:hypothetical protein
MTTETSPSPAREKVRDLVPKLIDLSAPVRVLEGERA